MAKVTINRKTQTFTFNCDFCGKHNEKKVETYYTARCKKRTNFFCNLKCLGNSRYKKITTNCGYCNKPVIIKQSEAKKSKSGKSFCNRSCAASYNNKFKKKSRRSKIEIKFFEQLQQKFPKLTILPNDKTMLDGLETDVAIPSLKLAIEWNGIVHFKPIYGEKKFNRIQEIDAEKLKIASNKDINLIVIADLVSKDKQLQDALIKVSKIIEQLI